MVSRSTWRECCSVFAFDVGGEAAAEERRRQDHPRPERQEDVQRRQRDVRLEPLRAAAREVEDGRGAGLALAASNTSTWSGSQAGMTSRSVSAGTGGIGERSIWSA